MKKFGLIGRKLGHSFSQAYFNQKFIDLHIPDSEYNLYELDNIDDFIDLILNNPDIVGLNVTVPYKESVIPFLDSLSPDASAIGAVNTIIIDKNGKTIGHNTDTKGFGQMLNKHLPIIQTSALVLGTGGASKAVCHVLEQQSIKITKVSRQPTQDTVLYQELGKEHFDTHRLIINTTPLGMFPDIDSSPAIEYNLITPRHMLIDLVYNPPLTRFLAQGKCNGAIGINGLEMLHAQAEASWNIWNSNLQSQL
ncbi:MAG: shikimate dehydrogenase [Flavobacteriales bacterium]|jgi:shikimate dehydrogenase